MGSGEYGGSNAIPGNIISGSQSFQASYSVDKGLLKQDKKEPDVYNAQKGYFKNPTATKLENAIQGDSIVLNGKPTNTDNLLYAVDTNGNFIIGTRCNPNAPNKRSPHPTLIGGKDPKVRCAGLIIMKHGKIQDINNQSGHYKPALKSMEVYVYPYIQKLAKQHPGLFANPDKWLKK